MNVDKPIEGSDSFGIPYPKNRIVAVFPGLPEAVQARKALLSGSFQAAEAIAIPGAEFVEQIKQIQEKSGVTGFVVRELSRLIGTDATYTDEDLEMATSGHAFLVVSAATEERKKEAWESLKQFGPILARHYGSGGVEVFRGPKADHDSAASA